MVCLCQVVSQDDHTYCRSRLWLVLASRLQSWGKHEDGVIIKSEGVFQGHGIVIVYILFDFHRWASCATKVKSKPYLETLKLLSHILILQNELL